MSVNIFSDTAVSLSEHFSEIDGVIIGGSGEFSFSEKNISPDLFKNIKKSVPFIKRSVKKNIPILGICLGHQLLGYVFGSKIINSQRTFGTFPVQLTPAGKKDPLFNGIPERFLAQQGHQDSIQRLPKGAVLLAESDNCKIEAFKIKNKNVYGVQFHPELGKKSSEERLLMTNLDRSIKFKKSPYTKKIISNFLDLK